MKKCHLIYLLLLSLSIQLNAVVQTPNNSELLKNTIGPDRTLLLIKLAKQNLSGNPDLSLTYSREAYSNAARYKQGALKGEAVYLESKALYQTKDYRNAILAAEKSINILDKEKERRIQSMAINQLGHIYWVTKDYSKALEVYQEALSLQEKNNFADLEINSLQAIGTVYRDKSEYEEALKWFFKAQEKANIAGLPDKKAAVLNRIAGVYWELGHHRKSLTHHLMSLEIRQQLNDKIEIANSMSNIGVVYKDLSDFDSSLKYHQEALNIRRNLGIDKSVAWSLVNIGNLYLRMGNYLESLKNYEEAFQIHVKDSLEEEAAQILDNMGNVYKAMNDFTQAMSHYQKAFDLRQKLDKPYLIALSLNNIGSIYLKLARYDQALESYLEALGLYKLHEDNNGLAQSLKNVGLVYKELYSKDLSLNYLEKSLTIYTQLGNKIQTGSCLNLMGSVYWQASDLVNALEFYMKGLRVREEVGDKMDIAASLNNIGLIYRDMNDVDKALGFYESALGIYRELANRQMEADVLNNIGNMHYRRENFDLAGKMFMQALEIQREINDLRGEAISSLNLSKVYSRKEKLAEARKLMDKSLKLSLGIGEPELIKNIGLADYELNLLVGNYKKALESYQLYTSQKDSILNMDNSRRLAELQIRYELTQKESQIIALKNENSINALTLKNKSHFIVILLLSMTVIMSLLVYIWLIYKAKSRNAMLLEDKNESLNKLNRELVDSRKKIALEKENKETIFSIIAHDLRSPVGSISNLAEMFRKSQNRLSQQEKESYAAHIDGMARSVLHLLDNLLFWSRSQSGEIDYSPEQIRLSDVIEDNLNIFNVVAENKNLHLINHLATDWILWADRNAVSLVFRNLMSNAIKFSREGGKIGIIADDKGSEVEIGIEDNGIGIDQQTISRILSGTNKGSVDGTKKEKGTGIGLSLCRAYLEKNGGQLRIESIPGTSTVFYFTFPKFIH